MASFNVWNSNRVLMVKCRPPKQVVSPTTGGTFLKTGMLRIGVFEKVNTGWAVNFNRNSISLEPAEIGKFLIPEKISWNVKKLEKLFPEGSSQPADPNAVESLQKILTVNVNVKTEAVLVNLQVLTTEGEDLHNVSTDVDLGAWLAFKEVARASIPLLCGFDGTIMRGS